VGYGKQKRKLLDSISSWDCLGYFGYGQGRVVAQFGEDAFRGKSACLDMCQRREECRNVHMRKMDRRYPTLANLVRGTVKLSKSRGRDPSMDVVMAMNEALDNGVPEAADVKSRLDKFKVTAMTDHYRCGQFENIDDGISKRKPGARLG